MDMRWDTTRVTHCGTQITASYDFTDGEDHLNGADVPDDRRDVAIHRQVGCSAWRGTGTPGSIRTGVIIEDFRMPRVHETFTFVMVQFDVDGTAVRLALQPDEADRLADTVRYLAQEARNRRTTV
jgi:hypothetical protein